MKMKRYYFIKNENNLENNLLPKISFQVEKQQNSVF